MPQTSRIPTRKLFDVSTGKIAVCDMSPGFTDEMVIAKIPRGKYQIAIETTSSLEFAGFTLLEPEATCSKSKPVGVISIDMGTIGVFEPTKLEKQFGTDTEDAFDWSDELLGDRSNWGGIRYDRKLNLGFMFVNFRRDCECEIHYLFDGRRKVGIRVNPKRPEHEIHLLSDKSLIEKFISERLLEYHEYENVGPGDDEDPISKVVIGYSFQKGWVSLVFDTRPGINAKDDVNEYLSNELNQLNMEHWKNATNELSNGNDVALVRENGLEWTINYSSLHVLEERVGAMIEDTVEAMRKGRRFSRLPLGSKAHMVVIEVDGHFRSPLISEKRVSVAKK